MYSTVLCNDEDIIMFKKEIQSINVYSEVEKNIQSDTSYNNIYNNNVIQYIEYIWSSHEENIPVTTSLLINLRSTPQPTPQIREK